MTLDPKLQTGVGFNQPVQQPSLMGGIADLAGLFVNTSSPKQPSTSDILAADKSAFYNELQKGRALIEQGKTQQGNNTITRAYKGFSRRYGREHEDVNTAFQDATGISFDVEVTGNTVDIEAIASTPEFNVTAATIQSQNPELTPDQVFSAAIGKETQRLATDMKIEEYERSEKVNWFEAEHTYVEKARQAGDTIRGILATAQADQVITPEEAGNLRKFYEDTYGSITKPVGVDQARWDKYQEEYIDPLTQIVDGAIGVGQNVGLSSDMTRALDQIVSKAVAQGKLPSSLLVKMQGDSADSHEAFIQLLGNAAIDPKYTDNYNFVMNASFDEMLNWVTEFKFKTDVEDLKIDTTEYDGLDNTQKRESLLNGVQLLAPSAGPEQVALDLLNTNAKLERLSTRALQPGDFAKVFSPAYFESIDKVFQENPIIGRQIAQDAVEAVAIQETNISRALESEARQLGFKNVGGKIVPDPENMPRSVQVIVDKHFGGDWQLAVQSGGKASNGITHANVKAIVDTARTSLQPKVDKLVQASKHIKTMSDRYLTPEVTGMGGEDTVEGSQGGDEITTSEDRNGLQPLLSLIDKTEGGGNYDTLFGHSQRGGGRFAGVKPSQMTIGEIREFTNPSGEYGQWVKAELGRQGHEARVATPLGRYQFVGSTLLATAKKMGLPDNTVFDRNTQDAMFAFKARERLEGKTSPESKRKALRSEWEGFKHVSDAQLDKAIAAFESGDPVDFGGFTVATGPTSPQSSVRPPQGAGTLRTQVAEGGEPIQTGAGGGAGGALETAEVSGGGTEAGGSEGGSGEAVTPKAAEQEWATLSAQTKTMLERVFGSKEAFIEALISGEVDKEDIA